MSRVSSGQDKHRLILLIVAVVCLLAACLLFEGSFVSAHSGYLTNQKNNAIERNGRVPADPVINAVDFFYLPTADVVKTLDGLGYKWDNKTSSFVRDADDGSIAIQFSSSPVLAADKAQKKNNLAKDNPYLGIYGINIVIGGKAAENDSLDSLLDKIRASYDVRILSDYSDDGSGQCKCGTICMKDVDYALSVAKYYSSKGEKSLVLTIGSQIHFKNAFGSPVNSEKGAKKAYDLNKKAYSKYV